MAEDKYIVKSSLPIEVHVGASEASATICWLGGILDDVDCNNCYDEKIYCENVYIGTNDCEDGKSSVDTRVIYVDKEHTTIKWHNIPISYRVIQSSATCETCGSAITECEILNYWVSPYIITPSTSSTTLYWEYWLTNRYENDDCDITREKKLASITSAITTSIPCDQKDREFPISAITECGKPVEAKYYIQKPDVCCDLSGDCYEINEIIYNPTSVPSSGGLVDFSFDYKRIEVDENCETKETYGTYFGQWNVPPCEGDECCYPKPVQSAFTWFDICGRGDVSGCNIISDSEYDNGDLVYISSSGTEITFSSTTLNDKNTVYLSIMRDKSVSADCEVHCDFDTVYCVDKNTVKAEYYDYETGQWSGFTDGDYVYPYYGGRLRVSWEYYIITIYEDCTAGISKGNKYTDLLTIDENNNCEDHKDYCDITLSMTQTKGKNGVVCAKSGDTLNISVIGEVDTECSLKVLGSNCVPYDGGSVVMKGTHSSESKSTSTRSLSRGNDTTTTSNDSKECKIAASHNCVGYDGGEIIIGPVSIYEIPYVFKKGLCDLPPSQLNAVLHSIPDNILPDDICPSEGDKCNEFTVTYYQFKKDCNPDCVPCFNYYMIDDVPSGGSAVTFVTRSDCDLDPEPVYGDGETSDGKFKNDCEDWVEAVISDGSVTFNIDSNVVNGKTGPYRRGKVIFTHDNGCKEEIIINQIGTTSNEDSIPDPGYHCSVNLEVEVNGKKGNCIGYSGGTIEIIKG